MLNPCVYEAEAHAVSSVSIVRIGKQIIDCCGAITLDEQFLERDKHIKFWDATPYKEVFRRSIMRSVPEIIRDAIDVEHCLDYESLEDCGKRLKETLKRILFMQFPGEDPVIMYHSSGYDSRILSAILAEIRDEVGNGFASNVYFICHNPEQSSFMKIMERQQWPANQVVLHKRAKDYYDIGNTWCVPNGFVPYTQQMNVHGDLLATIGKTEKQCYLLMGMYGGEWFDYPARNIRPFSDKDHCTNKALNRFLNYTGPNACWIGHYLSRWWGCIFPYLEYDYVRAACTVSENHIGRPKDPLAPDDVRGAILNACKYKMDDIPYIKHDYQWNMSQETKDNMVKFYNNSILYKVYGLDVQEEFINDPNGWASKIYSLSLIHEAIFNAKGTK